MWHWLVQIGVLIFVDNRFDMRPFLLPQFELAYRKVDREVEALSAMEEGRELGRA